MASDHDNLGTGNRGTITADEFWRCYFDGRITRMQRILGGGYAGEFVRAFDTEADSWSDQGISFSVTNEGLLGYDYGKDPKFSVGVYCSVAEALSAVIAARLMQTETVPNISQLRLAAKLLGLTVAEEIPYQALRNNILNRLANTDVELGLAINFLKDLQPKLEDHLSFKIDGDLDKLHVERDLLIKCFGVHASDPKICDALKTIIDNRPSDYSGTVELAIWALGRQNEKTSIAYLTRLMEKPIYERSLPVIERALQFMCSGEQFATRELTAKPAAYWEKVQGRLPKTAAGWAAHDAGSVFWEKRQRCAVEWARSGEHKEHLQALVRDEVAAVRIAAGASPVSLAANVQVKIINATKLDLLSLKELFGVAAAALAPGSPALRGAVPAFGEQTFPGVAIGLASGQLAAFVAWLKAQRALRRSLQIEITNQSGKDTTIALADQRYDDVDADDKLVADLERAISEPEKPPTSES